MISVIGASSPHKTATRIQAASGTRTQLIVFVELTALEGCDRLFATPHIGVHLKLGVMENPRDIQGFEFDWFAIDQDGHVALFATGGDGPVPSSVLTASGAHDAIGVTIAISGFGSPAIWQSYAQAGLYAFDWSESKGSYVRVAEPSAGVEFKEAQAVAAIPGLLRLPLSFSKSAAVPPKWQDGI